jgi:hypothetical protein
VLGASGRISITDLMGEECNNSIRVVAFDGIELQIASVKKQIAILSSPDAESSVLPTDGGPSQVGKPALLHELRNQTANLKALAKLLREMPQNLL